MLYELECKISNATALEIAEALASVKPVPPIKRTGPSMTAFNARRDEFDDIVHMLADMFQENVPKFNRTLFYAHACVNYRKGPKEDDDQKLK